MTLFKNKYRIASTRLKGWDYSGGGFYFVTICTRGRECFFGEIIDGEMRLSDIGRIARQYWLDIPDHSPMNIELDEFVIMPNHIHGIIAIMDDGNTRGRDVACNVSTNHTAMSKISPKSGSLGAIVRSYKSAVSRWARLNNHPSFAWQERYYEHIIRDEHAQDTIRQYIAGNAAKWKTDRNNRSNLWM